MDRIEQELVSQSNQWLKTGEYDRLKDFFRNQTKRQWVEYNSMAYVYLAVMIDDEEQQQGIERSVLTKVRDVEQIIEDFRRIRFLVLRNYYTTDKYYAELLDFVQKRGYTMTVLVENIRITVAKPEEELQNLQKYMVGED